MGACIPRRIALGGILAGVLPMAFAGSAAWGCPPTGCAVPYTWDFERGVGPAWSSQQTAVTPKGNRRFLGPLANGRVTLTLRHLPAHAYVRVSFDLLLMGSWDGGDIRDPDIWSLDVAGGPKLIHTTFGMDGAGFQAFPDNLPGPTWPPGTGAARKGALGYVRDGKPADSIYRLQPVFPHGGRELKLIFSGSALQEVTDESWGLDNVKVELLPGPAPLAEKALATAWKDLIGPEPVKARRALWTLALAGDRALRAGPEHLRSAPALDEAEVQRLIKQLDSHTWRHREEATQELRRKGRAVAGRLAEALQGSVSPEVRLRIGMVLEELGEAPVGAVEAGRLRTIRLMGLIGSREAGAVLAGLAETAPTPHVRCLAAAAGRGIRPPEAGWVNLLEGLDPHTRRANGEWTAGPSALLVSPVQYAKLPVPVSPRGDYELRAEFMRLKGTGEMNFILPVGNTSALVSLDDHASNSYLQNVNGKRTTAFGTATLSIGRQQQLRIIVRHKDGRARIVAQLNGKPLAQWAGPVRSLSVPSEWSLQRRDILGVATHETMAVFFRLDLRMLSGEALSVTLAE